METGHVWFIGAKKFTCKKCGRQHSVSLPVKASAPPNKNLALLAFADQSFRCPDPDCNEPAPSGGIELIEATESEVEAFESHSKSKPS